MKDHLVIGARCVGAGYSCLIIAEAGVNHNGSMELARQLINAAAQAGADAVKFQTFKADKLVSRDAPKAAYQKKMTDTGESQYEMLRKLELSPQAHIELMNYCAEKGILFLSTPFDEDSADLLADLGVLAFKIPSGEITNHPFLAHVARKNRPMIVSTGMSDLDEVSEAVKTVRSAGNEDIALLHCVSDYPADPADANLRAMDVMRRAFLVPVGFSDHMKGNEVALAAVALGACVIEKHLTIDRALPGPDHAASVEPYEMAALVQGIRIVESALGDGAKRSMASEQNTAAVARKSLVAARDLAAGTVLTEEMVTIKRPGTGLPPSMRVQLIGCKLKSSVGAGALFTKDLLE